MKPGHYIVRRYVSEFCGVITDKDLPKWAIKNLAGDPYHTEVTQQTVRRLTEDELKLVREREANELLKKS